MTRDPGRIDRILNLIAAAWRRNPDLRLGQLLISVGGFEEYNMFYREDDLTEEKLGEYLRTVKRIGE